MVIQGGKGWGVNGGPPGQYIIFKFVTFEITIHSGHCTSTVPFSTPWWGETIILYEVMFMVNEINCMNSWRKN